MNTLYLKYAVEVERTGSISQAAENLFMAQPNLSKAIKELETDLGITIFERSSRGVRLTPKGREFLNYAENILFQLEKMEMLSGEAEAQSFSVSLPCDSMLMQTAARFLAEVGDNINASVYEYNTARTIAAASDGSVRLGIIRFKKSLESFFADYLAEKKLESMALWEFEELAAVSCKNALSNKGAVLRHELDGFTEIVCRIEEPPYPETQKRRASVGTGGRITVCGRCAGFELLSELPKAYMMSPPASEEFLLRYGLVQLRCGGGVYADRLIFRKDSRLSESEKAFIEKIYAVGNKNAAP